VIFRVVTEAGVQPVSVTVRGVRNRSGDLVKVVGYWTRTRDCTQTAGRSIRIGSWTRLYPDNEFWLDNEMRSIFQIEAGETDLLGAISRRIHPEDADRVWQAVPDAIAKGEEWLRHDGRIVLNDGSILWAKAKAHIIPLSNGRYKVIGTIAAFL